jgi:hypothetical protein
MTKTLKGETRPVLLRNAKFIFRGKLIFLALCLIWKLVKTSSSKNITFHVKYLLLLSLNSLSGNKMGGGD